MKKTSVFVLILSIAPFILGFQLHRYIFIRISKSALRNIPIRTVLPLSDIFHNKPNSRVITAINMPIQIFFLPFNYSDPYKPLPKSFENLAFYSVFYGQKYTVKSWTSVCKLNVISYKNKSGKLDPGSPFFAYYVSHLGPIGMSFSNHLRSRSVFEMKSTYYFFLFRNQEPESTFKVLNMLSVTYLFDHQFWAATVFPSDAEYLKGDVSFSFWFITLVATLVGHPQVHLGELHIQFLYDQIVENVLSNTESLM